MSRGRVLSKVGGLTQTIAGISTFVGVSTFKSDVRLHGGLTVDGSTTFTTPLNNTNLANNSVSYGGVSVQLGTVDNTPAFNLVDATGYPTSSLTGTITNAQLAGSIANSKLANDNIVIGGVSMALGGTDATPALDLTDATNYPTSSLSGTITNAQLAGSISNDKLAGSIAASKLAGSIGNAKLSNSSITVTDGSNSTATALGGTITFSGTANEVEVAESSGTVTIGLPSNVTIGNNLTVTGNLQVDGDTTTVNTATMTVEDKNIEIAKGAANDAAADGAGITIDSGDGDKTWNWVDSTDSWTSSEHINLASGKGLKLNSTTVLSGTTLGSSIVTSSLTALGTITTGVWNGTAIANANLANSTVSYGGISLALGGTDATPAFDLTDATNYPTSSLSGTITNAQLAGSIASSKLANSGVSAGTVGSSTAIPIITVNAQGQITSTSTTAIDSTTIENGSASVAVASNGPITSTGNHDFTAGIDVTGNITVSGTVDGRDVATDGSKLDSIESAATADQTDEEIQDIVGGMLTGNTESGITVTYQDADGTIDFAVASQTDENFTTADHSKLDGIEAGATADQTASDIKTLLAASKLTNSHISDDTIGADQLADTSVTAASYGSATAVPVITVDAQGRITAASTSSITTTTNLATSTATDAVTVTSSTGNNATISEATGSAAGVMSTAHHDKLDGIEAGATADQTDEEIEDIVGAMLTGNSVSGITVTYQDGDGTIDFAVASQTDENFTTADHAKLDGIEASATADQTGAEIKSLYEAESDTNAFTDADHSKLDAIEASATADQTAAEIRTLVESASDSNVFTDADHSKLNGIEASATADQTDEEIQDIVGAMLSGNTESGITVTYQDGDGTIDFTVASQTDENFTTADHSKLDGIEASATADQTGAEIKTAYENESDTNALTDALLSKLNAIESGATADQTSEEIQDIVGAMVSSNTESGITVTYQDGDGTIDFSVASQTDENFTTADHAKLDGIEASATADQTASEILTLIKTVDGSGSGLDADTLDGISSASFLRSDTSDTFTGTLTVSGAAAVDNLSLDGNTLTTSSGNLTIDSTGGTTTLADNVAISGNLTVNGTTTTVNATTVNIADKNIQVATGSADDSEADGGGITIDSGDGDKTFQFEATGDNFGSSENMNLASGKAYKINNTSVLNATTLGSNVVASSLTSVGTIASGVWNGTAITNGNLANSTVSYGGVSLSLGGSDATPAFDLTDATNYPTSSLSGTITNAQLAGSIAASKLAGSIGNSKLSNSSVSYGGVSLSLGGSDATPAFDLSDATNYPTSSLSGTITNAQLAGSIASGKLASTGVSAASYGSASAIPIITVNAQGQITALSTASVDIDATQITQGNSSMSVSDSGTGSIIAAIDGSTLATFAAAGITLSSGAFVGNLTGNVTGNTSGSSGSCTGNAATATALANARTIAGVSFDGTGNISLNNNAITNGAGYITSSGTSAACSGNAATATKLAATKTIAGVAFDGSANISLNNNAITNGAGYVTSNTQLSDEQVEDIVGAMLTGNTESGITVTYQDGDGTIDFSVASQTDNNFTDADHSKLDGIASGATNVTNNNQLTNGAGYVTSNTQLSDEQVQDIVGAMVSSNSESGITVTYQDGDGTIDFAVASQTDNNFTNADHSKLDGIAAGATNVTNNNQLTNGAGYVTSSGLATTGGTLTGTLNARAITPTADSSYDLGTNSVRWANVYADDVRTGDLHLSNEHRGGNTIDGSWGHYTIEEGEDDLFIMNKRSGKKFRFVLEQV